VRARIDVIRCQPCPFASAARSRNDEAGVGSIKPHVKILREAFGPRRALALRPPRGMSSLANGCGGRASPRDGSSPALPCDGPCVVGPPQDGPAPVPVQPHRSQGAAATPCASGRSVLL